MRIAEKLYTQGLISYPRTETNIFPKELNLVPLVNQQVNNSAWGNFAQQLLEKGLTPRQGKKSDQAHPPIHPIKYADGLNGMHTNLTLNKYLLTKNILPLIYDKLFNDRQ